MGVYQQIKTFVGCELDFSAKDIRDFCHKHELSEWKEDNDNTHHIEGITMSNSDLVRLFGLDPNSVVVWDIFDATRDGDAVKDYDFPEKTLDLRSQEEFPEHYPILDRLLKERIKLFSESRPPPKKRKLRETETVYGDIGEMMKDATVDPAVDGAPSLTWEQLLNSPCGDDDEHLFRDKHGASLTEQIYDDLKTVEQWYTYVRRKMHMESATTDERDLVRTWKHLIWKPKNLSSVKLIIDCGASETVRLYAAMRIPEKQGHFSGDRTVSGTTCVEIPGSSDVSNFLSRLNNANMRPGPVKFHVLASAH
jgi:hypothetical protein